MASVAMSSDDSDVAPSEFPLHSSDDDLLDHPKSDARHRCPLCNTSKKQFYCPRCIRSGDFLPSDSVQCDNSERYVEKKLALLRVKGEIQELLEQSASRLSARTITASRQQEVRSARERIMLLKKWRAELQDSIKSSRPILEELRLNISKARQRLEILQMNVRETAQHASEGNEKIISLSNQLRVEEAQLKEVVRENVNQLMRYIFPITCEGHPSEEDSESLANVKDALADASQTAYVRGQWVYSDSGNNGCYRINGAALPGAGDMAAYQLCVSQAEKSDDMEPVNHFKVALSHTTQLTHLLGFYLNVRLPKRLDHLDFIRMDLDSRRFSAKIARLHANVLYLCSSQGVAPIHLRHANPLARLLTLLDTNLSDLGRNGPFDFPVELMSYEEVVGEDGGPSLGGASSGDISSSDDDHEDSDPLLNADWESVASNPLIPSDHLNQHNSSTSSGSTTTEVPSNISNSVVGGVVSSVTSLWKAWPWTK